MGLSEKIRTDMLAALKGGEPEKVSTLRMVLAAIKNAEIAKNVNALEEGDLCQIIRKQIKQRHDSIEQFRKGAREDLAGKESRELAILEAYLPRQLGPEEVARIVEEAIAETGASSAKDTGRVMKLVMEKVKGMADGKTVAQAVAQRLAPPK